MLSGDTAFAALYAMVDKRTRGRGGVGGRASGAPRSAGSPLLLC